jgi:hypothetical protein
MISNPDNFISLLFLPRFICVVSVNVDKQTFFIYNNTSVERFEYHTCCDCEV